MSRARASWSGRGFVVHSLVFRGGNFDWTGLFPTTDSKAGPFLWLNGESFRLAAGIGVTQDPSRANEGKEAQRNENLFAKPTVVTATPTAGGRQIRPKAPRV